VAVQHAMSTRHGEYSAAMRLGRSLKDRCTKADPEKDVLAGMLDQLKNKWNSLRSGATQRYTTTVQWRILQRHRRVDKFF